MIMAMFAFVGDRLVRKDDLYSYQVMEKTIKTVIPSLYKVKDFFLLLISIESNELIFPKGKEYRTTSADSRQNHSCFCYIISPSTGTSSPGYLSYVDGIDRARRMSLVCAHSII